MKRSAVPVHRLGLTLFIAIATLLLVIRAQAQQAPANLQAAIARIDAMAAEEYGKDKIASVTIGVVHGAQLVWTRSYGAADAERGIPATKDTVYRIGSISKQFTALMLLQLVQDGKASFSDPVERYLTEINRIGGRRDGAPPITLIQVATMTSGMGREP